MVGNYYDLKQRLHATTYICTNCGHFEFFNPKWAEFILLERKEENRIEKIKELDAQILKKEAEIKNHKENLNIILEQLNDLDITVRQSNELKERKAELNENINALQEEIKSLQKQKALLEAQ